MLEAMFGNGLAGYDLSLLRIHQEFGAIVQRNADGPALGLMVMRR